jgi:hypothetical protein
LLSLGSVSVCRLTSSCMPCSAGLCWHASTADEYACWDTWHLQWLSFNHSGDSLGHAC